VADQEVLDGHVAGAGTDPGSRRRSGQGLLCREAGLHRGRGRRAGGTGASRAADTARFGCSISIGTGLPVYEGSPPGSVKGLHLVVVDIERTRAELVSKGVDVSHVEEVGGGVKFAAFFDPDGNSFMFQEMAWRTGDDF
jgi:catechol 2,3-dioxygenase-like lactoylglutathione lyase family enzyme